MREGGWQGNKCSIPETAQKGGWSWRQELLAQLNKGILVVAMKYQKFHSKMKQSFFQWGWTTNRFPRGAVVHILLEIDKTPPDQQPALFGEGDRTRWFPDLPSNLYHAVILWGESSPSKAMGRKLWCWCLATDFGGTMWIYKKKRPPFPLFQLAYSPPLQYTPPVLAQRERGDKKAIP